MKQKMILVITYFFLFKSSDENQPIIKNILENVMFFFNENIPPGVRFNSPSGLHSLKISQVFHSVFSVGNTVKLNYDKSEYTDLGRVTITYNGVHYQSDWVVGISSENPINDIVNGIEISNNGKIWDSTLGWDFSTNRIAYNDISLNNTIFKNKIYNDNWTIEKIKRGVVYISHTDSVTNKKYVAGFINVYNERPPITGDNCIIKDVYWIDEPTSWYSENGYKQNFDFSLNPQIPLVDILVDDELYTIKNTTLGLDGLSTLVDIDSFLFINPLENLDTKSNNFYKLATRYDESSLQRHKNLMLSNNYLSSFYDALYYDHNWTRMQLEESADQAYLNSNYSAGDLSYNTLFPVIANNGNNILYNGLVDDFLRL